MGDAANKDEALRCIALAKQALAAQEFDRAQKLAEKGLRLFPGVEPQAQQVLSDVTSQRSQRGSTSQPTVNGNHVPDQGLRQRPPATKRETQEEVEDESNQATPEQKELVERILKVKCYYEILGVGKNGTDDEIKKAYRKLALKLHPDKNKANKADEAFKAVSRAFTTLSDEEKRKHYDVYGVEDPSQVRRSRSSGHFGPEDFDPDQIFQMFFNGAFQPGQRYFYRQYTAGAANGQGNAQRGQAPPYAQFLSILPILLLLLLTFFTSNSDPVYSLERDLTYIDEVVTSRFKVPFYVKSTREFERDYPRGTNKRTRAEHQVELDYKDRVEKSCYQEKIQQQRLYRWGYVEKAQKMELKSCEELFQRFGQRHTQYYY